MDGRLPLDMVELDDQGVAVTAERLLPPDATFRLMAEAMPQLVWSTTPDGYHDYFNERWYAYTGMPRPGEPGGEGDAPQGWSWKDYLHPDDVDRTLEAWTRSLATGAPYEIRYRFKEHATGAYRWFLARAVPLRDAGGRIARWFGTCTDIDEAKRTEDALALVARAGELLGSTLAVEAALAELTHIAVPHIADWCAIDLAAPGPDGRPVPRRVAVAHVDPAKVALARELAERYPDDPDAPYGVPYVLRTGRPDTRREIPAALLEAGARDAEHLAAIRALGLCSYVVVPILDAAGAVATPGRPAGPPAPARVLGAITFVSAESGRRYGERDVATATELARRGALALERARLYESALRDRERLAEQAEELLSQNERLHEQAAELEMQAEQLHEQATELEVSQEQLQEQAGELEASNEQLQATADELARRVVEAEGAHGEASRLAAERERLIAALRVERARLTEVFRQAPAFIAVLRGPEHEFEMANEAYYQVVGFRDIVGRTVREALPEVVEQGFVTLLDRVRDTGETYVGTELPVRLQRSPGAPLEQRYVTFVYQPLMEHADGTRPGIFVHGVDVTTQVHAREEVERARADAEAARERAEEANRAKSEFLASMSHELRTPLNAIGGYAELMEIGVRGPVTDAQREDLARIRRSQRHLLTLINDILNFARIEGGRVEYDIRAEPLSELVADVAPMIEPQIAAQRLTYEVRLPADCDVHVRADQEKVRQILLNLLSNAVKFTPAGGRVRVEIATPSACPEVALVRVSDTGIGIPADKLEAVFDAFVQVHAGLTRRHEGTGLGLAISRDLARGMGGDLTVESEPGVGSTFTLVLPRG